MKIYYYAHAMKIYNTMQELREMSLILAKFDNVVLYNPNRHDVQKHKNPMQYCLDIILSDAIEGLVFSKLKGKLTSGVHWEMKTALRKGIPVFELTPYGINPFTGN